MTYTQQRARPVVFRVPECDYYRASFKWRCEQCGAAPTWPWFEHGNAYRSARHHAQHCDASKLAVLKAEARLLASLLLETSAELEHDGHGAGAEGFLIAGDELHTLLDDFEGVTA